MHATGAATSKVIQAVEYVRRRIKGLHVAYEICSTEFTDVYEPLEKGDEKIEAKRIVPTLKAELTLTKAESINKKPGYMLPIPLN